MTGEQAVVGDEEDEVVDTDYGRDGNVLDGGQNASLSLLHAA